MDHLSVRLEASATSVAPALLLRPWSPADADDLAELYRDDEALRRWTHATVRDAASAARWIGEQRRGWQTGERFGFAVAEVRPGGAEPRLAGHVALRNVSPGAASAEVGYWTAAHARGRGVAPRALEALTHWAFTALPVDGPTRLELLHQVDNAASCRVASKTGYAFRALLPAAPPDFPLAGHVHVRSREV